MLAEPDPLPSLSLLPPHLCQFFISEFIKWLLVQCLPPCPLPHLVPRPTRCGMVNQIMAKNCHHLHLHQFLGIKQRLVFLVLVGAALEACQVDVGGPGQTTLHCLGVAPPLTLLCNTHTHTHTTVTAALTTTTSSDPG